MRGWNMKRSLFSLFLIAVLVLVVSCSSIPPEQRCTLDSDCVPAACCHAIDVVSKGYAPNCDDVICTLECQPDTLDCGQGKIQCLKNKCTVVLEE